ncbi:hypothetical protein [Cellulomonas xylanilytica]|uniref:DUF4126 domain-containing protein n=1 Tax=Cellulomonas xylanilytica TaxID=233583 RepID=A0A510V6G6_9CELL|nr:hypothetical protein [Cellulomonas xylanilytica]GEK22464.1 hypothetical protein CXY01_29840 [Cellulomonas xylanilytica]
MAAITRGLIAGAAGTVVLTAVTYLDMAVRGRPASSVPADTVTRLLGARLPGSGATLDNRREGVAALAGIGVGLGAGVAAALVRAAGFRPGPVAIGAATMAATDVPMARLGVTDPRDWTAADWAADVLPHLAFGAAVHGTLTRLDDDPPRDRPRAGLVLRSVLLGWAAGARSSLGPAGPTITGDHRPAVRAGAALAVAGEVVADKLPVAPSRLEHGGAFVRAGSGVIGATLLSARAGARPFVPAVAGAAGALAGAYGGVAWRTWAAGRVPDWQAALAEDAVALTAAAVACLPRFGAPGVRQVQ